jgi:effector-binding domain-containing protein
MEVTIVTAPPTPTAVVRETTDWATFPTLWRELLDEVWAFVRGNGLKAGRNVMVYADDVPNVEVGVELDGPFEPRGRVVASTLPAGQAAKTVLRGPPSPNGISAAHDAVVRWCDGNGERRTGVRWEVYGHWDDDHPDDFETEVYWLLSSTRSSPSSSAPS